MYLMLYVLDTNQKKSCVCVLLLVTANMNFIAIHIVLNM